MRSNPTNNQTKNAVHRQPSRFCSLTDRAYQIYGRRLCHDSITSIRDPLEKKKIYFTCFDKVSHDHITDMQCNYIHMKMKLGMMKAKAGKLSRTPTLNSALYHSSQRVCRYLPPHWHRHHSDTYVNRVLNLNQFLWSSDHLIMYHVWCIHCFSATMSVYLCNRRGTQHIFQSHAPSTNMGYKFQLTTVTT